VLIFPEAQSRAGREARQFNCARRSSLESGTFWRRLEKYPYRLGVPSFRIMAHPRANCCTQAELALSSAKEFETTGCRSPNAGKDRGNVGGMSSEAGR